jgi:hypothetical protein
MALPPQAPEILADLIRNQLSEIRQTEALESQVHEMVVAKRQKLVALVEQFLTSTTVPIVMAPPPLQQAPSITIGTAHQASRPKPAVAPVAVEDPFAEQDWGAPPEIPAKALPAIIAAPATQPMPAPATQPMPAPAGVAIAHTVPAPLAETMSFEEIDGPLPPNPSAQQVMDSLNRLMSGLKEISKVKQNQH